MATILGRMLTSRKGFIIQMIKSSLNWDSLHTNQNSHGVPRKRRIQRRKAHKNDNYAWCLLGLDFNHLIIGWGKHAGGKFRGLSIPGKKLLTWASL